MSFSPPRHGTYLGYITDKCRCTECRTAWRLYQRKRTRDIAYRGRTVSKRTDPARARAHILKLRARGIGGRTIAAATGVSSFSIFNIANGDREWIGSDTEAAILAYRTPPLTMLSDRSRIEGAGTHRRIRALQAIGWSLTDIAARLGCTGSNVGEILRYDNVRAKTARNIAAIYEELWNQEPPASARRTKTLNLARANGWPPPLAWDDEALDDPNATPADAGEQEQGVLVDNIAFILEHEPYATTVRLRERLGYTHKTAISNALKRAGRDDLLAQLARNAEVAS